MQTTTMLLALSLTLTTLAFLPTTTAAPEVDCDPFTYDYVVVCHAAASFAVGYCRSVDVTTGGGQTTAFAECGLRTGHVCQWDYQTGSLPDLPECQP